MAEDTLNVQVTADIDDLNSGMDAAADKVSAASEQMEGSTVNIGEAFEDLQGKMRTAFEAVGITLAIEALEKMKDVMEELAEQAVHLEHSAMMFNTNTESLQGLYAAATKAGVGTEVMDRAMMMLTARMQAARDGSGRMQEELARVGVTVQDLRDPTFSAADALYAMAESGATNGEMMSVLSRRGFLVTAAFGEMRKGQAAVNEESEKMGALNEEELGRLEEYHSRVAVLGLEWGNFKERIASEVAPALIILLDEFKNLFSGVQAGSPILEGIKIIFEDLVLAIVGFVGDVKAAVDAILGAFTLIAKAIGGTAAVIKEFFTGTYAEFREATHAFSDDMKQTWNNTTTAIENDINATTDAYQKMLDYMQGNKPDEILVTAKKTQKPYDVKQPKPKEEDPELKALEIEMEEAKKGSDEKIALAEAYALRSAQVYGGDVDKALEASKKVVAAYKEAAEEKLKIAKDEAKEEEEAALGGIEVAKKAVEAQVASGQLTAVQGIRAQEDLDQAKYAIEEAYYENLKKLEADDVEAQKKYDAEIVKLEQDAAAARIAANTKASQQIEKDYQQAVAPIESAFDKAFRGIVEGTMTLHNALKSILKTIVEDVFIKSAEVMLTNFIFNQHQMTAIGEIQAKIRAANDAAAARQSSAINAQTAASQITTDAAKGAAGAFQAIVGIPYVGPILAPIAAAVAEAAIMAFAGKVSSAAGGMMVPEDQLALLHQDEMVLPPHISQGISSMVTNNTMTEAGGSKRSGGAVTINAPISALDGRSVHRVLSNNHSSLHQALKSLGKRYNR